MTPLFVAIESFPTLTLVDWGWVALASAVIFALLGPRLWRDIQGRTGKD
jgi:hypothetical protein